MVRIHPPQRMARTEITTRGSTMTMQPGPYTEHPELDALFARHAELLQAALGDNFVGYYLQGSLATGGFDESSDVDFIVVIRSELSGREVRQVQAIHNQIHQRDTKWAHRLEYSFFPLAVLRTPSSPFRGDGVNTENQQLWYFDNGSKTIERSDHCNTLVVRWTLHNCGVTVAGPPISSITTPVSPDDLRREIRHTMLGWGRILLGNPGKTSNRFYQAYLVLNYCRMLSDLHSGTIGSKKAGMDWAKEHLDGKWTDLIDYSWKERQAPGVSVKQPADPEKYSQTLDFIRYALSLAAAFDV